MLPIIAVITVSINHVITWYDMGNPLSWAIYLSIAIEVAAMSALAAVTVNIRRGIWPLFIIVTLIQFIGNVFYSYKEIDILSSDFLYWMELTKPLFDLMVGDDILTQKRILAVLQGGMLPIISLLSLHFFIRFNENFINTEEKKQEIKQETVKQKKKSTPEEKMLDSMGNEDRQKLLDFIKEKTEKIDKEIKENKPEVKEEPPKQVEPQHKEGERLDPAPTGMKGSKWAGKARIKGQPS
jgi:hypothetical protein